MPDCIEDTMAAAVPKSAIGLFASCESPKPVTFWWLLSKQPRSKFPILSFSQSIKNSRPGFLALPPIRSVELGKMVRQDPANFYYCEFSLFF